jgi:hypothetical protein
MAAEARAEKVCTREQRSRGAAAISDTESSWRTENGATARTARNTALIDQR